MRPSHVGIGRPEALRYPVVQWNCLIESARMIKMHPMTMENIPESWFIMAPFNLSQ